MTWNIVFKIKHKFYIALGGQRPHTPQVKILGMPLVTGFTVFDPQKVFYMVAIELLAEQVGTVLLGESVFILFINF